MKEKVETAQLLGNVRVKLRTYGLRGYEPPEGLRVEVCVCVCLDQPQHLS